MCLQHFGLRELPFSRMPNTHFFILCYTAVMVGFSTGGYQVQVDRIALDDTEGVASPVAIYCPVYIAFAGIAASAAAKRARPHYFARASVCPLRVYEQLLF